MSKVNWIVSSSLAFKEVSLDDEVNFGSPNSKMDWVAKEHLNSEIELREEMVTRVINEKKNEVKGLVGSSY